jgi:hypothetical protein
MKESLDLPWQLSEGVGVGVAQKQQELEKQHAGGPDAGAAAEPGKDEFADHRLHLEEQKGAHQGEQAQNENVDRLGGAGHGRNSEAVTRSTGREGGSSSRGSANPEPSKIRV